MDDLAVAATLMLGGLMLLSGLAKLQRGNFVTDLANYRLLPRTWVAPLAAVIPKVEMATGLCLLLGIAPKVALTISVFLLVAFSTGVAINLLRGRNIACGCRGSQTTISWRLVCTNIALIMAAFGSIAVNPDRSSIGTERMIAVTLCTVLCVIVLRLSAAVYNLHSSLRTVEKTTA